MADQVSSYDETHIQSLIVTMRSQKVILDYDLLEKEIKDLQDVHESAIVSTLQRFLDVIDPLQLVKIPRPKVYRVHCERKINRL
jgi:hypothetical protein